MSERTRIDRRRQRMRGAAATDLASRAGTLEHASNVADGAPTGAVAAIVAETTSAQAQPNALLSSGAVGGLVGATIQHVISQAGRNTPHGHSLDQIRVFPREGATDRDEDTSEATAADEPGADAERVDAREEEQDEASEAQSAAVEAVQRNAVGKPQGIASTVASPASSAPNATRGTTAREARDATTSADGAPRPRSADPAIDLADAIGSAAKTAETNGGPDATHEVKSDGRSPTDDESATSPETDRSSAAHTDHTTIEHAAHRSAVSSSPATDDAAEAAGEDESAEAVGPTDGAGPVEAERGARGRKGAARHGGGRGKGGARGAGAASPKRGAAAGAGGRGAAGGKGGRGGRGAGAGRGGGHAIATDAAGVGGAPAPAELPAMSTATVALIDEELVEHQRWAGAQGAVGEAGSLERAAFVVDTAGGAALSGLASGAAMGLGMGLAIRATKFIPGLGGAIGGVMALHGLSQKFEHWDQTAETIGKFGEGNDTYETLANSIAAVAEIVDIVSQVLNAINGVVGVLTLICYGITAAGAIATVATLGAAAPVLAAAAEISVTLTEIEEGITAVTTVLDVVNAAVLQPSILLFRAMHTFTSQADPREVEASGGQIAQAAAAWGGTLGARAGGALAEVGSGSAAHGEEETSPAQHMGGDADVHAPPTAGGEGAGAAGPEGPVVHYEAPGGSAVDPHARTNLDIPAAHADTMPMPAASSAGTVDPHAATNLDIPAAHADTMPMPAASSAGAVDPHAATNLDIPAVHADTVPMPAAPSTGAVDPHAATNLDIPAVHADTVPGAAAEPGVSPLATTGEAPGVSPMAHSTEAPAAGPGVAEPAAGRPAVEPPPNAQLGGVKGWPPHDPYPGDDAPMGDRLAWGARQYEPGGQWHSEPLPPPTPPPAAPEPAPWVGPPRNPAMEMTPVSPADVYPGAPQPPGFRAGPVGSLGSGEAPVAAPLPVTAPGLPGSGTPVMQMTTVNPADVYSGAPQPPGFRAGPVGSFEVPSAGSGGRGGVDVNAPTNLDIPAAHAPTNLDIPAAHAPTNLDVPAVHAPTQPVELIPARTGDTLPGLGPPTPAADIPAQTGQTLPGLGGSGSGGGGGSEPPSSAGGSGGGSGGGGSNPLANASDAEIAAALDVPGHSDLMLSAPAPAAPTRFSDASEAEIDAAVEGAIRQMDRRGTVDGQPANLTGDFQNLTPAEQAALIRDPGSVRPRPAPDQPGPGNARYNISNGMMVNEVTIRAQSGRPGETGDVPTVIRVHTADPNPDLVGTNSGTGNTVTVTQGNQGARGQGVRLVPSVDADGNPVQTWHPTATASDEVMNASHIPIHRDPASGGAAGEPSVIVDEAALGLPPGSVVTNEPTAPRAAPPGPQPDVDWTQMRVEYTVEEASTGKQRVYIHDGTPGSLAPGERIVGSRLLYVNDGKAYPLEFDPQGTTFDPSAPTGPGPFLGTVGMPNYRHAPTTLPDGTVVTHPPEFKPEAYINTTGPAGEFGARVGPGGAWHDHRFATQAEADAYARTVALGDPAAGIPPTTEGDIRDQSALPVGWPPDASGTVWPGNPVDNMNVYGLPPRMPYIFSQVAPQPEGDPAAGAGRVYPGGGPQVQIPKGIIHPGSVPITNYPIQRGGFPSPAGGSFTPIPPTHPSQGGAPPRTPTLPGLGPSGGSSALGSTARVASATAGANAGAVPPAGTNASALPQTGGTTSGTIAGSTMAVISPVAPSTAEQVGQLFLPQLFGPQGEAPTHEQQVAAHNAHFTADNRAAEGIERVNPAYPAPPGTPQQLAQIQTEIQNLLAARARTEQAEHRMTREETKHREGQAPIQQAIGDTQSGISASQAHQQSVARHTQANQEQQGRQQQGAGLVSGYPSRAAGLAALTVPLGIFEGFTRYASILPGDAGAAMARMNADARRMEQAFAQMASTMLSQDQAQPARQAELQSHSQRLQTTNAQAGESSTQLTQASQGAQELQRANQQKLNEATQAKHEAAQQKSELGDAAAQKTEQAQTLSAQLDAWAPAHKAARDEAVHETEERVQQRGYVVRRGSP